MSKCNIVRWICVDGFWFLQETFLLCKNKSTAINTRKLKEEWKRKRRRESKEKKNVQPLKNISQSLIIKSIKRRWHFCSLCVRGLIARATHTFILQQKKGIISTDPDFISSDIFLQFYMSEIYAALKIEMEMKHVVRKCCSLLTCVMSRQPEFKNFYIASNHFWFVSSVFA